MVNQATVECREPQGTSMLETRLDSGPGRGIRFAIDVTKERPEFRFRPEKTLEQVAARRQARYQSTRTNPRAQSNPPRPVAVCRIGQIKSVAIEEAHRAYAIETPNILLPVLLLCFLQHSFTQTTAAEAHATHLCLFVNPTHLPPRNQSRWVSVRKCKQKQEQRDGHPSAPFLLGARPTTVRLR